MNAKRWATGLALGLGLVGVLLAILVPAAAAAPTPAPQQQTQPSPSVTSVVSGPTRVKPDTIAGLPGTNVATVGGMSTVTGSCGACINSCWSMTTRSGPSDISGSVYIYQHLYWCGNGAIITYGAVSQSYSQSGSYHLDGAYGPWWSGGCLGCSRLRASGYILWSWSAPLVSIPNTGTSHLDTTVYAFGDFST